MSLERGLPLSRLGEEARRLIDRALEFGRNTPIDLFLVGGAVRDLYLDEEVRDLDLVWVGTDDPATVSRAFGDFLQAETLYHSEFLTASFTDASGLRLDLGRARAESYSAPAALPSVRPADLAHDLVRRDFAVNAMAVPLERPQELIDPCNGFADLGRAQLRTMHALSFRDDPTRILRGLELAARRGFEFDAASRSRAEEAVSAGYLALLSGARVRHELERLLASPGRAVAVAESLKAFEIDQALHQGFRIDAAGLERLRRLAGWTQPDDVTESGSMPFWVVALSGLLWDAPRSTRRGVAERLSLSRNELRWLEQSPERLGPLVDSAPAVESSLEAMAQLYAQLSRSEARLVELLAGSEQLEALRRVRKLSRVVLGIGGEDLLAAGVSPGPRIRAVLDATLTARRGGELSADEELSFALEWLKREELDDGDE